jgi:hypothetical protein
MSFLALVAALELAAAPVAPARPDAQIHVDLPVLDARTNLELGAWPSMQQSLMLTKSTYYLAHAGLLKLLPAGSSNWPQWLQSLGDGLVVGALDIALDGLPLGTTWMHEEWHRAVLSRRNIGSYNGVYDFDIFSGETPVKHVRDEDLVRLKRDYPAEMARLSSAGLEGDLSLVLEFDRDRFFYGTRAGILVTEWLELAALLTYMTFSAHASNSVTADFNRKEGSNVRVRDFTGLDPLGWVYDLHRPNEPYEARGIHPSGVGIDRYRSASDLTPAERRFLLQQSWLAFLNLVNPSLYGIDFFSWDSSRWNASLQHYMAPFGYALNLNFFLQSGTWNCFVQAHANINDSMALPGITLELLRLHLPFYPELTLAPRADLWLQPRQQYYYARSASLGAAARVRMSLPLLAPLGLYVQGETKTRGWIAGETFLGSSVNAELGVEAVLF